LSRGEDDSAAITIATAPEAWAVFLTTPREIRRLPANGITLEGKRSELKRFANAFKAEFNAS
jgi:hypothetical protein